MISETACRDIMRSLNGVCAAPTLHHPYMVLLERDKKSSFKDIMTRTKNG